jgi:hypothetical protein
MIKMYCLYSTAKRISRSTRKYSTANRNGTYYDGSKSCVDLSVVNSNCKTVTLVVGFVLVAFAALIESPSNLIQEEPALLT